MLNYEWTTDWARIINLKRGAKRLHDVEPSIAFTKTIPKRLPCYDKVAVYRLTDGREMHMFLHFSGQCQGAAIELTDEVLS